MSSRLEGALVTLAGAMLLRLAATDLYLRYVKSSMRVWLLAAGAALVVVGACRLWSAGRSRRAGGPAVHRPPKVALLLLVPAVVAFAMPPPSLGAYFASRQTAGGAPLRPPSGALTVGADGIAEVTVVDFVRRSLLAPSTLEGVRVRMAGFVTPDVSGLSDFRLTRFAVGCCAADAVPVYVAVREGEGRQPSTDEWVEVVGRPLPVDGREGRNVPVLAVESVRRIDPPTNPYN